MERKIISGTYRDDIFLFGDNRTAYSDFSAKKSANEKNFYIMFENNLPAGYTFAQIFLKIFVMSITLTQILKIGVTEFLPRF